MRSNEEFKATVRRRCADLRQKRQRKRRLLALVMPAVACLAAGCLLLPSLLNHWPPSSGIGSECAESVYESAALSKEYMEIETEGTRRRITASAAIDAVRSLLEELILSGAYQVGDKLPTEAELALLARKCAAACRGGGGAVRRLEEADLAAIYRMAL